MSNNASGNAKSNENTNVFSNNPRHYSTPNSATEIQQLRYPAALPAFNVNSQISPVQPLGIASIRNAPASPHPKPPIPPRVNATTTTTSSRQQLSAPSQPRQAGTKGSAKRRRPAKPIPEIPFIPGHSSGSAIGTTHGANANATVASSSSLTAPTYGLPHPGLYSGSHYASAQQSMPSSSSTVQRSISTPASTWQTHNSPEIVNGKPHSTVRDQYASQYAGLNNTNTGRKRGVSQTSFGIDTAGTSRKRPRLQSNDNDFPPQLVGLSQSETTWQIQTNKSNVVKGSAASKRTRSSTKAPPRLPRTLSHPSRLQSSPLTKPPILPPKPPRSPSPPTQPPLPCLPLSPVLSHPNPELEPYSDPALASTRLPIIDVGYKPQPPMSQDEFIDALLEVRETDEAFKYVSLKEDEIIERTRHF